LELVSPVAVRLDLPPSLRIRPAFHVSQLNKYVDPSTIPHRTTPERPSLITVDDDDEYEVEAILDKRTRRRRVEYLVKWKGNPNYDTTWEPFSNLTHATDFVHEFELRGRSSSCDGANVMECTQHG
jgi:Chromo (CHRromatin Organisation MOdifier) domain